MEARLLFVQALNQLRVPFSFIKGRPGQVSRKVIFLPEDKQVNQGLHILKKTIHPGAHKGVPAYQVLAAELFAAWHKKGTARRRRNDVLKAAQASNQD